jgi:two-component system response regulator YesN
MSAKYCFYVIAKAPALDIGSLSEGCYRIISHAKHRMSVDLTFYLSGSATIEAIPQVFNDMKELAQNNVAYTGTVLVLKQKHFQMIYTQPDLKTWVGLLSAGRSEDFLQSLKSYLNDLVKANRVDTNILAKLRNDIYYLFRTLLEQNNLFVDDLFLLEERRKQPDAWDPIMVNDFLIYIQEVVDIVNKHLQTQRETGIITRIKRIISVKIDDPDISRDNIADLAGINPEYLSRLFHKETGMPLVEYIQQCKIEKACRLFREERLSVSEVASRLGYSNFSYFAKLFKKITGYLPTEYRKLDSEKYKNP